MDYPIFYLQKYSKYVMWRLYDKRLLLELHWLSAVLTAFSTDCRIADQK